MLIDSHVNLHAPQFDEDRDAVIARAREAGVGLMVEISDKLSTFEATHALAMAHGDIWATVGVHPHEAKDHVDLTADCLVELAARPKIVGIGECGLDFHYDLSPRDMQAAVFRQHIAAARRTGLPLVVHAREADTVMADILAEEQATVAASPLMPCCHLPSGRDSSMCGEATLRKPTSHRPTFSIGIRPAIAGPTFWSSGNFFSRWTLRSVCSTSGVTVMNSSSAGVGTTLESSSGKRHISPGSGSRLTVKFTIMSPHGEASVGRSTSAPLTTPRPSPFTFPAMANPFACRPQRPSAFRMDQYRVFETGRGDQPQRDMGCGRGYKIIA